MTGKEVQFTLTYLMKKDKHPVEILIHKFTKTLGLPFQEVLPSSIIEQVLIEIGIKYKSRIYNPIVMVWSFRISCIRFRP